MTNFISSFIRVESSIPDSRLVARDKSSAEQSPFAKASMISCSSGEKHDSVLYSAAGSANSAVLKSPQSMTSRISEKFSAR